MSDKASISIARPRPTGLAARPSCCVLFMNGCSHLRRARRGSSPTRPRRRYSIRAAGAPGRGSSSPMCVMIAPKAEPILREWPMSTPPMARPSDRRRISMASSAPCRSTGGYAGYRALAERNAVTLGAALNAEPGRVSVVAPHGAPRREGAGLEALIGIDVVCEKIGAGAALRGTAASPHCDRPDLT